MINVYFGGADRDRDRFLFDRIMQQMPADVVLLVPDQYTLQAERNAFQYMNTDTLLELEIMSRSGFMRRVAARCGEPAGVPVDKYGRFMLLAGLIREMEKEDQVRDGEEPEKDGAPQRERIFDSVRRKRSFLSMLNDQISELKQYNITPEELKEIAEALKEQDDILYSKLTELQEYFGGYEQSLAGRFTDSEDYQQDMIRRIGDSDFVKKSIFWITEFDYMTPKFLSMVEALGASAPEVNILLTGAPDGEEQGIGGILRQADEEFFRISTAMEEKLRQAAEHCGTGFHREVISREYLREEASEIDLVTASNFYTEAESVAIDIARLVREEGLRYRDIAIICNDAEKRGSVFRRVFDQYGIPLFMDRKRDVIQEPAIAFLFSMLEIIRKKRRFDDIFRMLKTGFGPAADSEWEELEKYCRKYNIRSGRWKADFVYGRKDEGEETLLRLNGIRQRVDEFLRAAEQLFDGAETVRQRCEALYRFLTETARMPQILADMQLDLEAGGLLEEAEMTGQMWDTIVQILDQMVEVLGDAALSHEEFNEILQEGFEEVELGLLPTNNDQVIFGTMQRTRIGEVKVLFVAGANDGVLPESGRTESLLSDEEKQLIAEQQGRISRTRELREMEQSLAMYKNLTKASRRLIVSYAELDTDGAVLRPSELAEELRRHAGTGGHGGAVQLRRDYISAGDTDALLQTASAASGHVTAAMRRYLEGEPLEDRFRAAALALHGDPGFDMAKKGLYFSTPEEKISRKQVKELFGRGMDQSLILSTSAFERYSRCPFSFFIMYGIRPQEERRFTVDMRSIGDIYHECMRRTAQALTREGVEITAPDSPWMTVTREECRRMTGRFVDEFADRYREGILKLTGREAYIRERIREICFETAWLMILQVQRGRIRAIYFEQRFGKRSDAAFPPVILHPEGEEDVYIEGIIDRVDVIRGWSTPEEALLFDRESARESAPSGGNADAAAAPAAEKTGEESGSEQDYIRIIDYKSGNEKFDLEEVRSGWRLQLMVYLKGAMGAVQDARPAGVFYFAVKEPRVDVSGVSEDAVADTVEEGLLKGVKLDGAVLDNASVIEGMDADIEGYSEIIPVYHKKDGTFSGTNLLSPEDFGCLMEETDQNLRNLAADFASGRMDPDPKSGKTQDACRYCSYTSICCRGASVSVK